MELHSKFKPGDKIWCIGIDRPSCLTVGLVRVEITDSPGMEENMLFSNYQPQKDRTEKYMCVETGIGGGTIYTLGKHIFSTKEEAEEEIARIKEEKRNNHGLPTNL